MKHENVGFFRSQLHPKAAHRVVGGRRVRNQPDRLCIKGRHPDLVLRKRCSGLQLTPNLPRLVLSAMDIDIQVTGLKARVLLIGELGTFWDRPYTAGLFVEGNDRRPALAECTQMDM